MLPAREPGQNPGLTRSGIGDVQEPQQRVVWLNQGSTEFLLSTGGATAPWNSPVTAFTAGWRRMASRTCGLCSVHSEWQLERVADKIRRVVGVLAVRIDPFGH